MPYCRRKSASRASELQEETPTPTEVPKSQSSSTNGHVDAPVDSRSYEVPAQQRHYARKLAVTLATDEQEERYASALRLLENADTVGSSPPGQQKEACAFLLVARADRAE
jgi:hypothetical protein